MTVWGNPWFGDPEDDPYEEEAPEELEDYVDYEKICRDMAEERYQKFAYLQP